MKLLTALCLAACFFLLVPFGSLLAHPPAAKAPKPVRRAYAEQILLFSGLQVLCLVGAGSCATLIIRAARKEFREQAAENLKRLLEGRD